jgi:glycosyltransferase involved in cell wall biosynthesis
MLQNMPVLARRGGLEELGKWTLPVSVPATPRQTVREVTAAPAAPKRQTVTLLIPTLNEIDGMKAIMPQIQRSWVDQILVLDGGSTDGTAEWAREHGYEVYVQKQAGIRQGYMEALPLVRGDVLLTFSPDGNSVPELIPALLAKMAEGYDMVIASRYLGPAKSQDDDWLTGFGNWLFTRTVNLLNRGRYTDAMVIYRAYRKQLIYDLELDQDRWYRLPERLFSCRISWEPMLSFRAAKRGLRVTEIPGDEPPRIGGERKLRVFRWGASYYYQFLRDALLWR